MINDVIESIQNADTVTPVCKELKKFTDNERVCASALEKLYGFGLDELNRRREACEPEFISDSTDEMIAAGAIEPVIACIETYDMNESIQEHGILLLVYFVSFNKKDDEFISVLTSSRVVGAIFFALENFPDSKGIHGAALGCVSSIEQACSGKRDLRNTLFTNMLNANALELSLTALERHTDDNNETVYGALNVFRHLLNFHDDRFISQTVGEFFSSHPNIRSVIEHAVEEQQRLEPDGIFVHREGFMIIMKMNLFGM